jgi:hypothetical protein
MAAALIESTKEKQRTLIRLLWSKGVKISEIYRMMTFQYGDNSIRQRRIYEWVERFK